MANDARPGPMGERGKPGEEGGEGRTRENRVVSARRAFGDKATASWRTMPDLGRWVREGNRGKKEGREGHEKTEKRRRGGGEEGRKERRGEESARREARLWR